MTGVEAVLVLSEVVCDEVDPLAFVVPPEVLSLSGADPPQKAEETILVTAFFMESGRGD